MDNRTFFLQTLRDLLSKVASNEEYDLVRASALVRQLLIDQHCLVHVVNREARVQLVFDVLEPGDPPLVPDMHVEIGAGFWFSQSPARTKKNLDAFLAMRAGRKGGLDYSVKDLVLFLANAAGGVHRGAPRGDGERLVEEIDRKVRELLGVSIAARFMRTTGEIVLDALRPLEERLR